jgi:hypothetical protein
MDLAIGDHDVGGAGDDRCDEIGDSLLRVLVVPIDVDDDVGAELQGSLDAVVERPAEPSGPGVMHELRHAVLTGNLHGPVRGPVVNDQYDDLVDTLDVRGDGGQDRGKGALFVEARDLHHQPHGGQRIQSRCPAHLAGNGYPTEMLVRQTLVVGATPCSSTAVGWDDGRRR